MSGFQSMAFDDDSECTEDMLSGEIPPDAANIEVARAWLKVHGWPCTVTFILGCYFTVGAAFVWSFWL